MPGINKLAATKVKRVSKPGRYGDGAGLWLQVAKAGTKSWIFQFKRNGRARQLGLGSVRTVSLADARQKAKKARDDLDAGIDPIKARMAARQRAFALDIKPITFSEAAGDYIAAHSPSWKNPKHRAQWSASLQSYAYPVIGKMNVADIGSAHIRKILQPIWTEKPETASRLRARIENILDAAKASGQRAGDNPASWSHLEHFFPRLSKVQKVRNHPAMPYAEMPAFMPKLRERQGIAARALEVLILTASRTGELIAMCDDELDLDNAMWVIPAERMKAGKEHYVPLCARAVQILRSLPREKHNPYLFAGQTRQGAHLSNAAMLALMKHIAPKYVPHGFRSAFTDWANEETATPHHVVEMALAHTIDNKTERAYRRGALLEKRRLLTAEWEAFLYGRSGK